MNTGDVADYGGVTDAEALALAASLLPNGGPIPTREPYRVSVGHGDGLCSVSVERAKEPITVSVLVWEAASAAKGWATLEGIYYRITDKAPQLTTATKAPEMPGTEPWLGTILLPAMAMQRPERYYALHEEGLRNGSFFQVSKYGIGQFINGDFMGSMEELPTTYAGQPLVEFPTDVAERLIPDSCRRDFGVPERLRPVVE